jgi:hypothetical protein
MLTNVVNCILLIKLKKKNRFCPLETRIFDSEHLLISWREVILEKRLSCLIQHDPLFSLLYKKYHLQKITIFACKTLLSATPFRLKNSSPVLPNIDHQNQFIDFYYEMKDSRANALSRKKHTFGNFTTTILIIS